MSADRELMASLLAAEFKLAANLRLLRTQVPEHEWGPIITRAARLLAQDPTVRAMLDKALPPK